jgi:hypothetical protein
MGVGVSIAGNSLPTAALILIYLAVTLHAAMRTEERFLRQAFGPEYDAYCHGRADAPDRPFSCERAWRNREYRAVLGLCAVFAILALEALLFP